MDSTVKNLHPLEIKVLQQYTSADELCVERICADLNYKEGHANQAFSWLGMKGLVEEIERKTEQFFELTETGVEYAEKGTPQERILDLLKKGTPKKLPEIAGELGFENKTVGSAFGQLSKDGCVKMDAEKCATFVREPQSSSIEETKALLQKALKADKHVLAESNLNADEKKVIGGIAKKRGAADSPFRIIERDTVTYRLTKAADTVRDELKTAGITGDELGALSVEMLKSGEWQGKSFRPYNIQLPPARLIPGRTNAYADFLESVKDRLVGLGFEEFDGDLVESDFWNSDALFMPQFHAARDIHDVYYVKNPTHAKSIEEPYLSAVAQTHKDGGNSGSRGWGYNFDTDFTRRLLLRSQGTVLSAHQLTKARVPGKYFGIARCFRYDQVDATHLSDFYQTEGIVLGNDVNLRTLLGLLKTFAVEIAGATEVRYVGGYFPFTEPSIEVHIKHPVLGWFELGGSGIFRPEVTKPLGIDVPVLAWGLGIDRMALMALGLNDLRELFSTDIEAVRLRK